MPDDNRDEALEYHSGGRPGKIEVVPTKPTATQRDLSLAYTPGVAIPCLEIAANPADVYKYTAKGNLVAVITNGTAVLGLGNIGAAGRQAGDGGERRSLQAIRRHRCLRHRDRHTRYGGVHPLREAAGADVRRDQSRGHRRAGVLRDRGAAEGRDEHPGLPRRPARHGHHLRRCAAQRAGSGGEEDRGRADRLLRRGRGGHGLPAALHQARCAEGEHAPGATGMA